MLIGFSFNSKDFFSDFFSLSIEFTWTNMLIIHTTQLAELERDFGITLDFSMEGRYNI